MSEWIDMLPPLNNRADVFEAAMQLLQSTQEWLHHEIARDREPTDELDSTVTDLHRVHTLMRAQLRALYSSATDLETGR